VKNSGQCIKCKGQALWIVDEVQQPDPASGNLVYKMVVTSQEVKSEKGANATWWNAPLGATTRISAGSFQVIVCATCGYTEWYAYNLENLKNMPGARLVGPASGDTGPYR
jgi:predicted nucleic-acid-binding Zn-ribbon protein